MQQIKKNDLQLFKRHILKEYKTNVYTKDLRCPNAFWCQKKKWHRNKPGNAKTDLFTQKTLLTPKQTCLRKKKKKLSHKNLTFATKTDLNYCHKKWLKLLPQKLTLNSSQKLAFMFSFYAKPNLFYAKRIVWRASARLERSDATVGALDGAVVVALASRFWNFQSKENKLFLFLI